MKLQVTFAPGSPEDEYFSSLPRGEGAEEARRYIRLGMASESIESIVADGLAAIERTIAARLASMAIVASEPPAPADDGEEDAAVTAKASSETERWFT